MKNLISINFLLLLLLSSLILFSSRAQDDQVRKNERRCGILRNGGRLSSSLSPCPKPTPPLCGTGNPIDDCWRCDPNWANNRKKLADCAIGFGLNATGGKYGSIYTVTEPNDDDPVDPKPGTLRYGAMQSRPLWITFVSDMTIKLQQELLVNSHKTIDGRGADIHIAGGGCLVVQNVTNVIIHGIHIRDCVRTGNALVRRSPSIVEMRVLSDGDGITINGSSNVWVDHNSLSNCSDGLIDATHASTNITISNNHMTNHNKVMLLGHSDRFHEDNVIQITVTFNRFGEGLVQRMPRFGNFHVVNNDYQSWGLYAIGGSSNPTINCEGNRFFAANTTTLKQVTRRQNSNSTAWSTWNWRSQDNLMLNGAYFISSGSVSQSYYEKAKSLDPLPSALVGVITSDAGALKCKQGHLC